MRTLNYLPPEFFTKGTDIDQKTDIWQIGVLFYEISTGRLPFNGNNIFDIK